MKLFLSFAIALFSALAVYASDGAVAVQTNLPAQVVDAGSLRGKVLCGYQGWFRCPGDGASEGCIHWSRDSHQILPATLTFEMWPDMTDYPPEEKFAAPGFMSAEGRQAYLFSSVQP